MIEVRNLTKKYGSNAAVKDLSFTIDRDRIYGFLGPNGAGKSTTMNIITGYLSASEGSVTIDGYDILKDPIKAKKNIGYLPEIPPVYPDMTIREYLDFAGHLKGISGRKRKEAVSDVMERTGITEMKDRLIKNLSKGYMQRAGLAQAILGDPDVIILDEPTVGLDPGQIIEIRSLLRSLRSGHTILLSSHILQEISAVCDHIMIISKGRLVASDTTENITGSVRGLGKIELLVRGGLEEAKKAAQKIEGASETSVTEGNEEGTVLVELGYPMEKDLREAVFYAFASSDVPILNMESRSHSLEDIYLELTGKDPAEEGEEPENDDKSGLDEKNAEGEPSSDEIKTGDEKTEDKETVKTGAEETAGEEE